MSRGPLTWTQLAALPAREAAALLVDRLEAGDVDEALVDRWLAAGEENRAAWARARDAWDCVEGWEHDPALVAMRTAALDGPEQRPRRAWVPYAAAASLLLAVSGVAITGLRFARDAGSLTGIVAAPADVQRFGAPDLVAGAARPIDAALLDGSKVHLSPGTALDLAYADGLRLARLQRGEATFDVRHDPAHPFRIAAGDRVVTDTGTLFSIRLASAGPRVRLVRGSVTVSHGTDPKRPPRGGVTLIPGQELVADGPRDDVTTAKDVLTAPAATKMLTFDDERLSDVVQTMNRASTTKLVLAQPALGSLRISGSFRASDPERFGRALGVLYPTLSTRSEGGRILIESRRSSRP